MTLFNQKWLIPLAAAVALGGCVSAPKPLYNWDSYESTVYQYYRLGQNGPHEQIAALQRSIETARAKDLAVPPGLYAHMGLLYSSTGDIAEAYHYFTLEKQLFPESAPFMDFLLSHSKRSRK